MPKIRLQKFIADCGVCSRRQAEKLIAGGAVKVNGQVVREQGTKVDPTADKVSVNGKLLKQKQEKIYIKLNKPRGVVSSCRKHGEEKTILDLVQDIPERLFPIGRLDKDSEGLMILTNDGDLANKLMHPRYEHEKEYEVTVMKPLGDGEMERLRDGVRIDGKKTLPAKVKRIDGRVFRIALREGKKRQVRNMVQEMGSRTIKLKRIRIKNVCLDNLEAGKYAFLTESEMRNLFES
ncbi:pseudouridine synthase [Candidatus Margulisiibacteriota bacterium]